MGIQRYAGAGWAGPAKAAYTLYEKDIDDGGPPIWVRARSIWRVTNGQWQSAVPGSAPAADIVTLTPVTVTKNVNTGTEVRDPQTGDPNIYWESTATITVNSACHAYAVWLFNVFGEVGKWQFMGSYDIAPGGSATLPVVIESDHPGNTVHWCVTAWSAQTPDPGWLPGGQQGFSRFDLG